MLRRVLCLVGLLVLGAASARAEDVRVDFQPRPPARWMSPTVDLEVDRAGAGRIEGADDKQARAVGSERSFNWGLFLAFGVPGKKQHGLYLDRPVESLVEDIARSALRSAGLWAAEAADGPPTGSRPLLRVTIRRFACVEGGAEDGCSASLDLALHPAPGRDALFRGEARVDAAWGDGEAKREIEVLSRSLQREIAEQLVAQRAWERLGAQAPVDGPRVELLRAVVPGGAGYAARWFTLHGFSEGRPCVSEGAGPVRAASPGDWRGWERVTVAPPRARAGDEWVVVPRDGGSLGFGRVVTRGGDHVLVQLPDGYAVVGAAGLARGRVAPFAGEVPACEEAAGPPPQRLVLSDGRRVLGRPDFLDDLGLGGKRYTGAVRVHQGGLDGPRLTIPEFVHWTGDPDLLAHWEERVAATDARMRRGGAAAVLGGALITGGVLFNVAATAATLDGDTQAGLGLRYPGIWMIIGGGVALPIGFIELGKGTAARGRLHGDRIDRFVPPRLVYDAVEAADRR